MINPITSERELAYIVKVDEVRELEGYDRIAHYRVNGWWCVSGKGDYEVGDLAVYIEIIVPLGVSALLWCLAMARG